MIYSRRYCTQSSTSLSKSTNSENVKLYHLKDISRNVHHVLLATVGAQLNEAQLELRKACTQTRAMQGELVLKNQKLADSEVDKRLQEVKKLILEEQKTRLSVKQQQLSEELVTSGN